MASEYYVQYVGIKHGQKYDPTRYLKIIHYFAQNADANGS